MLARPRIASGDVNSLSRSIQETVSSFVLTILATIESETDSQTGLPKYRLREVGAGYSMDVGGELKIVTLDDYAELGLQLGFFQRQMLSENEKQLETAKVIARTSTLTMFDTPALLHRTGHDGKAKHQDFVMRHFVWVDSRTGRSATLVWLLERDALGEFRVADEAMRLLPPGVKEDRAIHVDGDQFLLGIPTARAFALEDLPPGRKIEWAKDAAELAALGHYDMDNLRALTTALSASLRSLQKTAVVGESASDQR